MRTTKTEIVSELNRLAQIINITQNYLPTVDQSQESRPNIAFGNDGTLYYEVCERGNQVFSFPSFNLDHLMYLVFRDVTYKLASEYEASNRKANEDYRKLLFSKQTELMQQLSLRWTERLKEEISSKVHSNPYLEDNE